MKICYLADLKSIHAQKWIEHFRAKGHIVHVISYSRNGTQLVDQDRVHSVQTLPIPKLRFGPRLWRTKKIVEQICPDVLHGHGVGINGLYAVCTGFHPVIVSVWGSDLIECSHADVLRSLKTRWILGRADAIFATSCYLSDRARDYVSRDKEIFVTPFGVDVDVFAPRDRAPDPSAPIRIGCVKHLEDKYGIRHLIRAVPRIRKQFSNIEVSIVGGGTQKQSYEDLVSRLGIEGIVRFSGEVPHSEIPELLKRMDIFVMPSEIEGFGVAALEASAAGLPVLASKVGGIPEVVKDGETGILIPPGDQNAIAQAVVKLAQDPQLRHKLGENGRRFVVENFTWTDLAGQIEMYYKSLLERFAVRSS